MSEKRVRVESDGLPTGTKVLVDGEPLENVLDVQWAMDWESCGRVVITLDDVDVVINQDAGRWKRYRAHFKKPDVDRSAA